MTTILPLGTTVCQGCRTPVAVMRRTLELPCDVCPPEPHTCDTHTHAIPDVAWTVVEADGTRHLCLAGARTPAREVVESNAEETVWTSAVTIEYAAPAVPVSRLVPTPGAALRLEKD